MPWGYFCCSWHCKINATSKVMQKNTSLFHSQILVWYLWGILPMFWYVPTWTRSWHSWRVHRRLLPQHTFKILSMTTDPCTSTLHKPLCIWTRCPFWEKSTIWVPNLRGISGPWNCTGPNPAAIIRLWNLIIYAVPVAPSKARIHQSIIRWWGIPCDGWFRWVREGGGVKVVFIHRSISSWIRKNPVTSINYTTSSSTVYVPRFGIIVITCSLVVRHLRGFFV